MAHDKIVVCEIHVIIADGSDSEEDFVVPVRKRTTSRYIYLTCAQIIYLYPY